MKIYVKMKMTLIFSHTAFRGLAKTRTRISLQVHVDNRYGKVSQMARFLYDFNQALIVLQLTSQVVNFNQVLIFLHL